ncbi:MAG TPA: CDP-diacylglycerol--serine O-phosphatidyltransferase [Blastocatellia bacterium]|nr:CDP-diacylglycerol--serine O-phosphatidyltransferase [Blastocatellia bacterium]
MSQLNASSQRETEQRRRPDRKLVFVVPSLVTTGNIFCGFYSVTESLAGAQALSLGNVVSATEHFDRAAVNIGFSFLCDFLDGRIARMTGATTEFGVELDSIADVLSFGIAPALLAFAWGYGTLPQFHKIAWAVSFVYLICGALRLARFNVQARQPSPKLKPKHLKAEKKAFVGMPIPAGAVLVAAIAHFSPTPLLEGFHFEFLSRQASIPGEIVAVALLILVACLGLLMVSTIRYSSLSGLGYGKYHPRVLILGITFLVLSIWFYSRWSLLILATTFVSHGVILKIWGMSKSRKHGASDQAKLELDNEPSRST